jgi:hypothetical protein
MHVYTNMTWPGDPYRTGQQLYRRPAPRLAAFTAGPRTSEPWQDGASAAVVYLPLHRTQPMTVTEETLTFGFHAVSTESSADASAMAVLADLDLMQARRHAAVLTGHFLPGDLAMLRIPAGETVLRGATAIQLDWPDRHEPARDRAAMFDCLLDLPGDPSLEQACQQLGIRLGSDLFCGLDQPDNDGLLAARTVQRALAIALICARHLDRYRWEGTLHTGQIMATSTWDCFTPVACAPPR